MLESSKLLPMIEKSALRCVFETFAEILFPRFE